MRFGSAAWRAAKPFENALYEEIIARLKQDDSTRAVSQERLLVQHALRARQGTSDFRAAQGLPATQPEEILLDANVLAAGHDYYRIGALEVSPDSHGSPSARTRSGRRQFTLRFKNLRSGEILAAAIADVEADLAWANDNRTLLYVEKDPETLLGLYVKKHVLGEDPQHDALVFEQKDKSFYTGVSKSKSDAFIFIHMESTVSSEWRYARADDPALRLQDFPAARARS